MEGDIKSYMAGGAIAACRFVKVGGADLTVIQAASGAATIFGVTEQVVGAGGASATTGDMVDVIKSDYAYLELGDAVTRGQYRRPSWRERRCIAARSQKFPAWWGISSRWLYSLA
jgi:hypothetical protein